MNDSEKYYTPDIIEFHIGFEYEWNRIDSDDKFEKGIIHDGVQIDDIYGTVYNIRVKYPDKEDIESLGWTFLNDINNIISFAYNHLSAKGMSYELIYISISKWVVIREGSTIFSGRLKNKSELKKLMKQLNIENND